MKTETVKIKTFNAACARAEKNELAKHGRANSRGTISQNAILMQHGAKVEEVLPDLGLLKISGDWRQAIKVAVIADRTTTKQQGAKAQHTAGPWLVGYKNRIEKPTSGGGCIVLISERRVSGLNFDQVKANAHLIAAAPDLLAACQLASVRLESGTTEEIKFNASVAKQLRSAIKRARGGKLTN